MALHVLSELWFVVLGLSHYSCACAVSEFSHAAVLRSEIVEAFDAEVSGGLQKSLLERLEGFKSFSASVKD